MVDTASPGFTVTRRLEKLGWHCSDTAELSFVDVRVPAANLVGAEGTGFRQIMRHFASERVSMAVQACATAQRCLDLTIAWCRHATTFGAPLADRQVVRHRLAEMARVTAVARTYVWSLAARIAPGSGRAWPRWPWPRTPPPPPATTSSTRPCSCTAARGTCADSEVERHYRDARIMGIGGGTTEIMNEIIAKGLLDARPG